MACDTDGQRGSRLARHEHARDRCRGVPRGRSRERSSARARGRGHAGRTCREGSAVCGLAVEGNARFSGQEFYRRQIVYAFAGSDDPSTIAKLLSAARQMRTGELRYLTQYMASEPVASAILWNWYRDNYSALLARLSRDGMTRAPSILQNACDIASRNALDAFFASKTEQLTGTAHTLALAEQRISRCIAFRQARSADVVAALRAAGH